MADSNPETIGSFNEYSDSLRGVSEEVLIAGYTKRLIDSRNVNATVVMQSFDVGLQAELSKLTVKGI